MGRTVLMSTLAWRFSSFFSSMSLYSRFRLSGSAAEGQRVCTNFGWRSLTDRGIASNFLVGGGDRGLPVYQHAFNQVIVRMTHFAGASSWIFSGWDMMKYGGRGVK